jgi:hypothetical protein
MRHLGAWILIAAVSIALFAASIAFERVNEAQRAAAYRGQSMMPAYPLKPSTITEVSLSRSVCLGRCPAYIVTYRDDGSVTYVGRSDVTKIGTYAGSINFARLADWIDAQHPESLSDRYGMGITDAPIMEIIIRRGATTKTIDAQSDYPTVFYGLLTALDGAAENIRWHRATDADRFLGTYIDASAPEAIRTFRAFSMLDGSPHAFVIETRLRDCPSAPSDGVDGVLVAHASHATISGHADRFDLDGETIVISNSHFAGAYYFVRPRDVVQAYAPFEARRHQYFADHPTACSGPEVPAGISAGRPAATEAQRTPAEAKTLRAAESSSTSRSSE